MRLECQTTLMQDSFHAVYKLRGLLEYVYGGLWAGPDLLAMQA